MWSQPFASALRLESALALDHKAEIPFTKKYSKNIVSKQFSLIEPQAMLNSSSIIGA